LTSQNAVLLENPLNSKEIAEKIDFLFNNPRDRSKIAYQGFKKSQGITWNQTLEQTLTAYRNLTQPLEQAPNPL
jgi:glycosyltransferase involved in cell wall biosynthesis